tara:strand:- start:13224 stop:14291 length:1068 start_codon:yes stop_codon:yes gene_type:complete
MINNYFLLPSDIKVADKKKIGSNKVRLRYNNELNFSLVDLCVLDSKKKIKSLEIVDLNNNKLLKDLELKYSKLSKRLSKIYYSNNSKPKLFKGNNPKIMGILNVTEDSFYDGGKFYNTKKAIKQAYRLVEEGADIIDVGGESTRPGASIIPQKQEVCRILPVIKELCKNNITVSCDTRNSVTMKKVLDEGVEIINDVSGLNYDKNTLAVIKEYNCYYVLMHSLGTPSTMQINPKYENVIKDLYSFFLKKISLIKEENLNLSKIIIDPGIGFGKNDSHNFQILKYFSIFLDLGLPILIGLSRKSFIGRFIKNEYADRLPCSLALAVDAFLKGASFIRVHDVKGTKDAIDIFKEANY